MKEFTEVELLALKGAVVVVRQGFKIRSGPEIPPGTRGSVLDIKKTARGLRLVIGLFYQNGLTFAAAYHQQIITPHQFRVYMRVVAAGSG